MEDAIRQAAEFGDGFWMIYKVLRKSGRMWNHKKVYRVYKAMHYEKRSKFVSDAVECGRKFRVLNIIDDCDRLAIAQEVSMSMPAKRVIKILEKVIWLNGKPKNIRCDNGPEFIATDFQNWCKGNEINILFTQPGCPTQNSYIERFNGSYRRAVLDAYIFRNLNEAREQTEIWRKYYNEQRPHESLDNMTPIEYRMNKAV